MSEVEQHSATVLLVEDDEASRDMLARRLGRAGFTVLQAPNGAAAHAQMEKRPDIVVLDMLLPDEQGWNLAVAWKQNDLYKSIPIIGLSALPLENEIDQLVCSACDVYLTKPVNFPQLLQEMGTLLTEGPKPKTPDELPAVQL